METRSVTYRHIVTIDNFVLLFYSLSKIQKIKYKKKNQNLFEKKGEISNCHALNDRLRKPKLFSPHSATLLACVIWTEKKRNVSPSIVNATSSFFLSFLRNSVSVCYFRSAQPTKHDTHTHTLEQTY